MTPRPPQALSRKSPPILFQRRLQNTLRRKLKFDLPSTLENPRGEEFIIVAIQPLPFPPFIQELPFEFCSQNFAAESRGATGEGGQGTINGIARTCIEVSAFEVGCSQEMAEIWTFGALDALTWTRCSDSWVFKGCD